MSTLRMDRHFPVAPPVVFAFVTQSDNLLQWWGPEGTSITEHDLDFSRLGYWSATMVGPQGHAARVGGEVIEVDPPNAVALTLRFYMDGGERGPTSTIRFEMDSDGAGGTRFRLIQTGLKADEIADMQTKGWASALLRLERLLT
jgi:uncharacterized protein YndB with AHSA1/START domain